MENKITIEDEGDYIRISGQFEIGTVKGKEIKDIVGIAEDDSDENGNVSVLVKCVI